MSVSLPIADGSPLDQPMSVAFPSESRMPGPFESVPLDEGRWDAWRAKGRVADAAFAEKMRSMALVGLVVAGAVGMFWIGFD